MTLKPEALPSVGLAEVYLQSTPVRSSNQCVTASTVVMMALRQFGLLAEPVSLLLDAPDGRGGTTRYGNEDPRFEDGAIVGHVGLVGDDYFMDITAVQFPQVARSGVRVIHCPLNGQAEALLRRGAVIPVRLLDGTILQYHVNTLGSADALILPLLDREGAAEELALLVGNLLKMYTVLLSSVPPLLERVNQLTHPRFATFVKRVNTMEGSSLRTDDSGVIHVVRR